MAILSPALRRRPLLHHRRSFSSSAAASPPLPPPPPTISASVAKTRLRREFDPDKALSILSSLSYSPNASPANARSVVCLTVRRLAKSRRFSEIESFLESQKKSPHASNETFLATLILSYGDASMIDHAVRTFEDVPRFTSAPPTVLSFNAVLSACIRAKKPRRVPYLFADLSKKHSFFPDASSYSILIKSLCLSGESKKAFVILKEMEEKKIEPNTVIYTILLDSLYKEGRQEEAEKLWREMLSKGCAPDMAAYNVRVMHHALHGKPEEVLEVVDEIKATGLKPDTITFNFLITSYCKNGRFEDASEIYRGLKGKDCGANAATFKNFLHFLCQKGDLDTGMVVYKDSVKKNKIPNFRTMSFFVEELVKGSRVDEAKAVICEVKSKFPENLLTGWKTLEKKLGLLVDDKVSGGVEPA